MNFVLGGLFIYVRVTVVFRFVIINVVVGGFMVEL